MCDRILGPVQHGDTVADRPAGSTGDGRRQERLAGRANRPAARRGGSCRALRGARTAALLRRRRRDAGPRRTRCPSRSSRGLETDQSASGAGAGSVYLAPASAKRAAARSSPESKALPSPNHSSSGTWAPPLDATVSALITVRLIVPVRVNNSWMSRTLAESNVYRSGCCRKIVVRQRPQSPRNRYLTEVV